MKNLGAFSQNDVIVLKEFYLSATGQRLVEMLEDDIPNPVDPRKPLGIEQAAIVGAVAQGSRTILKRIKELALSEPAKEEKSPYLTPND